MEHEELIRLLSEKLEDLGLDYDRMSTSGQETYNEIMSIVAKLQQQKGVQHE